MVHLGFLCLTRLLMIRLSRLFELVTSKITLSCIHVHMHTYELCPLHKACFQSSSWSSPDFLAPGSITVFLEVFISSLIHLVSLVVLSHCPLLIVFFGTHLQCYHSLGFCPIYFGTWSYLLCALHIFPENLLCFNPLFTHGH